MAEEENVEVEEEAPEEKKKGSKKLLVIIILAVVLLGGGGFVGWKFFLSDQTGAEGEGTEMEEETDDPSLRAIHSMKPFIVNLLGNQGKRYLKAKIDLEVRGEESIAELTQRQSELRDAVLLLLASKSFGDISEPEGKVALRNELVHRINEVLEAETVRALYFTEFVVQ